MRGKTFKATHHTSYQVFYQQTMKDYWVWKITAPVPKGETQTKAAKDPQQAGVTDRNDRLHRCTCTAPVLQVPVTDSTSPPAGRQARSPGSASRPSHHTRSPGACVLTSLGQIKPNTGPKYLVSTERLGGCMYSWVSLRPRDTFPHSLPAVHQNLSAGKLLLKWQSPCKYSKIIKDKLV